MSMLSRSAMQEAKKLDEEQSQWCYSRMVRKVKRQSGIQLKNLVEPFVFSDASLGE